MDSEDELDMMVLALVLLQKKKRKKRRIWAHEMFRRRPELGVQHLVDHMEPSNREAYFK